MKSSVQQSPSEGSTGSFLVWLWLVSMVFFSFFSLAEPGGVDATKALKKKKKTAKDSVVFMREARNAAHCSHLHKSPFKGRSDRWPSALNHTFEANSTLPLGRRDPGRRFRSRTTSIHHLTLSPVWGHWGNWGYWAPLPAATGERQEQTHSLGSPSTRRSCFWAVGTTEEPRWVSPHEYSKIFSNQCWKRRNYFQFSVKHFV